MKFNIQALMDQAQQMQKEIERLKEEANKKITEAESGGGMVKVVMNGEHQVVNLKISPEIVDKNEIEMLEDLIVAAVNKASKSATELVANEMNKANSMLPNIPGLGL